MGLRCIIFARRVWLSQRKMTRRHSLKEELMTRSLLSDWRTALPTRSGHCVGRICTWRTRYDDTVNLAERNASARNLGQSGRGDVTSESVISVDRTFLPPDHIVPSNIIGDYVQTVVCVGQRAENKFFMICKTSWLNCVSFDQDNSGLLFLSIVMIVDDLHSSMSVLCLWTT